MSYIMWKQKWMGGGVLRGNPDQVPLSLQTWTFWGMILGDFLFVFNVTNIIPKILQNIASAVSKVKGWVGLGETPCPSVLSLLLVTAFILCARCQLLTLESHKLPVKLVLYHVPHYWGLLSYCIL